MSVGPSTSAQYYRNQYNLGFQIAPIILQGGIAAAAQGGLAPITTFTGGLPANLDDAFAYYFPLPGSTLISQSVGMYPFANQQIAANATVQQPLTLSMLMVAPVNQAGGYQSKYAAFNALQSALQQHNAAGGLYIVATPAFLYQNLILTAMTDASPELSAEDNKQVQIIWQLDFIQPLVTLAGAAAALNTLLTKVTSGTQIIGQPTWSGNTAASSGALVGITGALSSAWGSFGETITNTGGFSASTGASPGSS